MLRRNRDHERGQTLILALAFLAMFGLFAATALSFASGVQHQRVSTENTAKIDSVAEGSAQFAIEDTGVQGCGSVSGGQMKFASGDTLTFTAGSSACSSATTSSGGAGQNCGLCVLNYAGVGTPLSVHKGNWTVPAEIDVNGSVSVQTVCSGTCPPANGRIGLYGSGVSCSGCTNTFVQLANKVLDPLAGALPIPTPGSSPPDESGNKTLCPGSYHNLSVGNGQILFLAPYGQYGCPSNSGPSLFIITGAISNTGGGAIASAAATLYLSPSASISFGGNPSDQISIDCGATPTSATCGTANTPETGPYAGVAVFMDPANTSTLSFNGNGNFTVAGTFEASHAILSMGGNGGTQSFQSGRLIISEILGSGNGGAGLGFGGSIANSSGCNYWNDSVAGTLSGGSSQAANVRFETACNSGSPTSIVSFAYGNGP